MSPLGWVSGVAVVIALALLTMAVSGLVRLPDLYLRLHSAAKAATFGLLFLAVASVGTGDAWIIARALLIALFVLLTSPVSAHAIGRAAFLRKEPMAGPVVRDESGRLPTSRQGDQGSASDHPPPDGTGPTTGCA